VSQAIFNVVRLIEGRDDNGKAGVSDGLIVVVPERWR